MVYTVNINNNVGPSDIILGLLSFALLELHSFNYNSTLCLYNRCYLYGRNDNWCNDYHMVLQWNCKRGVQRW